MRDLLRIEITGVEVKPEETGNGWEASVQGDPRKWARGETFDEAVGRLIRRLASPDGANQRPERGAFYRWSVGALEYRVATDSHGVAELILDGSLYKACPPAVLEELLRLAAAFGDPREMLCVALANLTDIKLLDAVRQLGMKERLEACFALAGLLDGMSPERRETALEQCASVIREAKRIAAEVG